ncbi:DNA replication/repair protein RecF [Novosphingobium sp. KCTC 2891]|uniref:DNA replication/repair protein RecF n=1 Tax=Novosphingobium sp. KCTC 2891 TaxID=2989730 RepID=UPI0022220C25|nr:DNA replication/repair protein RecF [Novosphingobium sp. KCTC 2891]MCW1381539.1 DNA replication/repair protein RecF [Novosphingobium sp. KCTC 2891]
MALTRLTLRDFRNHAATRLEDTAAFNVLVGENGAGKTNVLEAISLFAPGRGLRRAQPSEMAGRTGDGSFAVAAEMEGGDLALGTATLASAPNSRTVRINGASGPATRLAEWLSITWLTPAMDRLFAEGPSARRRFLDRLVLAVRPDHARTATRYETALRERGRLLSDPAEPDPAWLDALEAQLAETGTALAGARRALVGDLAAVIETLPEQPFARPALAYASETPADEDALRRALREGRRRDRAAGRTLTGPHRDDLAVMLAAKNAPAADCSTGEQKAMLIAIVLAHAALTAGPRPRLLLLDEIAAHLDPLRRAALYERLAASGAQVWMTGTEIAPFAEIAGEAAVWRVAEGAALRV